MTITTPLISGCYPVYDRPIQEELSSLDIDKFFIENMEKMRQVNDKVCKCFQKAIENPSWKTCWSKDLSTNPPLIYYTDSLDSNGYKILSSAFQTCHQIKELGIQILRKQNLSKQHHSEIAHLIKTAEMGEQYFNLTVSGSRSSSLFFLTGKVTIGIGSFVFALDDIILPLFGSDRQDGVLGGGALRGVGKITGIFCQAIGWPLIAIGKWQRNKEKQKEIRLLAQAKDLYQNFQLALNPEENV